MGLALSFLFGFGPMLFFAWLIYWLDRFEKEPKLLLGGVFLWGAMIASSAAFIANSSLAYGVYRFTASETTANLATGSLIAPIVEEIAKGAALVMIFFLARHEFDSLLDGVIYAAIVALGFAAAENTLYIYRDGYQSNGYAGMALLIFVRVVLVGWQHPFYSAFFGAGLAFARLSPLPAPRMIAPAVGLVLSMTLHSIHNVLSRVLHGLGGLVAGTIYDWTGWLFMFGFILWAIRREQQWVSTHLCEEVRLGALTDSQYHTACSTWRQSMARLKSLFRGNYQPTSRFYQVCGELAHKKNQLATLGDEGGNAAIIHRLRAELLHLSPLVPE